MATDMVSNSVEMFKDPATDTRRAAVTTFGELARHG
jgi:hypothetical protein